MTHPVAILLQRCTVDDLGAIPAFLAMPGADKAAQRLDMHYRHGGGWSPMAGWEIVDRNNMTIRYPGDTPLRPLAAVPYSDDEQVYIYPHAWVLVLQVATGEFEVARMD